MGDIERKKMLKIQSQEILGPATHYNGIILGDHIAYQADCEGALAVWGNTQLGSQGFTFDIGAAGSGVYLGEYVFIGDYTNPNKYPSFILGGTLSQDSRNCRFYLGDCLMKSSHQKLYENGQIKLEVPSGYSVKYIQDDLINAYFSQIRSDIRGVCKGLNQCGGGTLTLSQFKSLSSYNLSQFTGHNLPQDFRAAVVNIDSEGKESVQISQVSISSDIENYTTLVINVPGKKVLFSNGSVFYNNTILDMSTPKVYAGNATIRKLTGRIIWNLYEAEEVEINQYGIPGSVLAPEATVTAAGGSVNGYFIAKSLVQKGGFELHGFLMSVGERIWSLAVPEDVTGDVEIRKVDSQDPDMSLSDAGFSLYQLLEGEWQVDADNLTTDQQGRLMLENLELGEYKLVETKAPIGYKLPDNNEIEFTIAADAQNQLIELQPITITNDPVKTSVKIIKVDADDSERVLSGAVFTLYKWIDGEWEIQEEGVETDADGELVLGNLGLGSYRLEETQAPYGYDLPDETVTFFTIEVSESGHEAVALAPIVIANAIRTSSIAFIKVDSDDPSVGLEGAEFILYQKADGAWTEIRSGLVSDRDGKLHLDNLKPGDYRLTETLQPDGYVINDSKKNYDFTIELNAVGSDQTPEVITLYNEKIRGFVEIIKLDSEHSQISLPGAVFALYYYEEEQWELLGEDYTTDENGRLIIEDLLMGDYRLVETKAPFGYHLSDRNEVFFTLETDKQRECVIPEVIIISNTEKKGSVKIIKTDADDRSTGLASAVFNLYQMVDGDWELSEDDLVTDADGGLTIEDLPAGEYKLVETVEPHGYVMPENNETLFSVSLDEKGDIIELAPILITNDKLRGSLEIIKVNSEERSEYLEGAQFTLYRKVDGIWVEYASGETSGEETGL